MKKTALVIMAAGVGSRFGNGIKQLAPVGPNGEIIMDYSIYDAIEAGFNKVVFIIRKDIEKEFGLRPSTATEVLKALEKKELICRVSEKQDARLKRIEFTSKAEEIRHLIAAEIGESESILLKGITEEERQIFIAIGERMLKNLDEANQ